VYSFGYDANGRLARETSPAGAVHYEHDPAGQLVRRASAEDAITRFEYDAAGYRVSETGPDLERRYRWDELGRLSEIDRTGRDAGHSGSIHVAVDALGELAAVDRTRMLWDSAHPLQPLTWNGKGAVIGEGSPWALASAGAVQWLAPDWQGTIGDKPRDPWGARPGETGLLADAQLGYRGEVEFDAETWLRHRVYQPASRCFSQPDPIAPAPGTASAANQYHYAANNPIGRSDPLGLHPLTDKELKAAQASVDHNILDKAKDYTVDHAGDISAITGIAAAGLAFTPLAPLSPFLAGVSGVTGALSSYQNFRDGKPVQGVVDAVSIGVGGVAAYKALRAGQAASDMTHATQMAVDAIEAGRGAQHAGLSRLANTKYSEYDDLAARARAASTDRRILTEQTHALNAAGVTVNVLTLADSHAKDVGIRDPLLPPRAPKFGLL
jgi:RHS repeat-associated protein